VRFTSWIASRIDIERSLTIEILIDCGSWAWNSGSSLRTESTTCTVLALGWRCTDSRMERSPL